MCEERKWISFKFSAYDVRQWNASYRIVNCRTLCAEMLARGSLSTSHEGNQLTVRTYL